MKTQNKHFLFGTLTGVAILSMVFFLTVYGGVRTCFAQQSENSVASRQAANSGSPESSTQSDEIDSHPQHLPEYQPTSSNLHTSREFLGKVSPLHWGRLSVVSFSYLQAYQTDTRSHIDSSVLKSSISYAVDKGGMDFVAEYSPAIWVSQSGTRFNFANHDFDLATHRKVGRWVLGMSDSLYALPLRSQFSQFGFDPAYNLRNTDPALILGDALSNSARFTLDRLLGPADRLQLGLGYLYYKISNASVDQSVPRNSTEHNADASLYWNHRLGWRSSLGLDYTYSQRYFNREIANLPTEISRHHSVMATYSFEPKPAWSFSAGFGPTIWRGAGARQSKSYIVSASARRKFRRAAVTLTFNRSDEFVGIIGDNLSNQLELAFAVALGRKWSLTTGGTYTREVLDPHAVHGWRSGTQANYALGRNFYWFLGFSFIHQSELSPVNSLPSYFASTGIRWEWNPKQVPHSER